MTVQARSATTAANIAGGGFPWNIVGYPTGGEASVNDSSSYTTDYISIRFAPFAIPTDATVNSVTLFFSSNDFSSGFGPDNVTYTGFLAVNNVAFGSGDIAVVATDGNHAHALSNFGAVPIANINNINFGALIKVAWIENLSQLVATELTGTPAIYVDYTPAIVDPPPEPPPPPPPPGVTPRKRTGLFRSSP